MLFNNAQCGDWIIHVTLSPVTIIPGVEYGMNGLTRGRIEGTKFNALVLMKF